MPPTHIHHHEFAAPPELQNAVRCLWYNSRDQGADPSTFEVVPDGYAEVIFHFGSGCSILTDDGLQPLPSLFLMGLLNRPAVFQAYGKLQIIGIRCYPWAVFDLLELPSGKAEVLTCAHPIAGLHTALHALVEQGRLEEAIAKASAYLLETHQGQAKNSMLRKAGLAMQNSKGALPVSKIASAAHATVRTLERNFKRSSGHTVKDVSALMRFEQARNQLWHYPETDLAALAHELGYADQPHFTRTFKRYTGVTPAAFARKAKQDKLIAGSDFVAFIQV